MASIHGGETVRKTNAVITPKGAADAEEGIAGQRKLAGAEGIRGSQKVPHEI